MQNAECTHNPYRKQHLCAVTCLGHASQVEYHEFDCSIILACNVATVGDVIAIGSLAVAYELALASAVLILLLTAAVVGIRVAQRQITMIVTFPSCCPQD